MTAWRAGGVALGCALAGAAHAGWTLAREVDFSRGDRLDPAVWLLEHGLKRNREAQSYQEANVGLAGGAMVLEARREPVTGASYTSGSVVLREPIRFGRIEVVARSPSGKGVWPAVWLLNEGRGEYGEIDLFEAVGKHPDTVFAAVHFGHSARTRQHRGGSVVLPGFDNSWRTHTLEWTPERIAMSVDAHPVFSFDPRDAARDGTDPLRRPMFLHLNLALGGTWGGAIDEAALPARFEIARIRVWRFDPAAPDAAVEGSPAGAPAIAPALGEPTVRWGR